MVASSGLPNTTGLFSGLDAVVKQCLRVKPIEAELADASQNGGLHKTLTAWHLVMFGVSAMIGTGIFVLTGEAAANAAGPALVISILLTGFLCGLCALCYSELSTMIPVAGSAYSYLYAGLGELAAWFTGWILIVEYLASVMAIAMGWGETVKHFGRELFSMQWPAVFTTNTFEILEGAKPIIPHPDLVLNSFAFTLPFTTEPQLLVVNGAINALPFLALLVITYLLSRGIEENAQFATIMVYVKTSVILPRLANLRPMGLVGCVKGSLTNVFCLCGL
jgi:basic amino acid/polyamine antiporter, APA family